MHTQRHRLSAAGMACALLAAALAGCLPAPQAPTTTAPTPGEAAVTATAASTAAPTPAEAAATPTTPPPARTPEPQVLLSFAFYRPRQVTLPESYAGYTLPLDPAQVEGLDSYGLSAAQVQALAGNGFFVAPGDDAEFFRLYEALCWQNLPIFVTTDSALHAYHLLFDKVLRTAEREHFAPDLLALSRALLATAEQSYAQARGSSVEPAAARALAYFAVAARLQDPEAPVPAAVQSVVAQELALIEAHAGWAPSPLMAQPGPMELDPYQEDYSQYVPRGHYTTSQALERYFKAMMWYGRLTFRIKDPEETRTALVILQALRHTQVGERTALEVWESIYQPTTFFVGRSDDLSVYDYNDPAMPIYGGLGSDPRILADPARLDAFMKAAQALPAPRINSLAIKPGEDRADTIGFRLMGQRFVVDAYILDQLMYDRVGTMQKPRLLPRGLDVAAAFGSHEAYSLLEAMGETAYAQYPEQMAKVQAEVAALPEAQWHESLYWGWLYTFQPLLEAKDARYPAFMRTPAWARKDLQTTLGSWTELKHDTILYAKQAGGLGGGEPEAPPPAYVEPNPEVYARLAALAEQTATGLEERGLLGDRDRNALNSLQTEMERLQAIAEQELAGQPLSVDDTNFVRSYGAWLRNITNLSADSDEPYGVVEDPQAALVADVATAGSTVLEEATGRIDRIHVVVPVGERLVLAQGGTYSYYEFTWPSSDRLTDEAWRGMLAAGQAPARPAWVQTFTAE